MFWKPNLSHIHGLGMALLTADAVDGSQAASTVCDDYPVIGPALMCPIMVESLRKHRSRAILNVDLICRCRNSK
jgi:hypothetical protein